MTRGISAGAFAIDCKHEEAAPTQRPPLTSMRRAPTQMRCLVFPLFSSASNRDTRTKGLLLFKRFTTIRQNILRFFANYRFCCLPWPFAFGLRQM